MAVCKAFLEHYQAPHSSVAVLEWMDAFETLVQFNYVFQRLDLFGIVACQEDLHLLLHILRTSRVNASDLVREPLVVTDCEPVLAAVRCPGFEHAVQFLDKTLRQIFFRPVNDEVNATEVVDSLNDVIHPDALSLHAYGIGLEDVPCLVMRKLGTFNVI